MKRLPVSVLLVVLAGVLPGLSCHSYDCRVNPWNQSDSLLRRVPVAPDYVPPKATEELAAGDRLRKQSYSIDPDGTFTYYRSVETEAAYFGADFSDLSRDAAKRAGVEPFGGVKVKRVQSRGPAAAAGLRSGDVILSFEDKTGLSADRFDYLIEQSKPGQKISLSIQRDHESMNVVVELGSEKRIESGKLFQQKLAVLNELDRTGMRLVELTDEVRPIVLGSGAGHNGLLVMDVLPGGPAFFAGVKVRDVITAAGDQAITSLGDYSRSVGSLEVGSEASLSLRRDGATVRADLEIDSGATAESGFDVPVLTTYQHKPEHRSFEMLLGFLFNTETCYAVRERDGQAENFKSRNWGVAVDLIKYTNNSRGKGRIVLLWCIPIWWWGGAD